LMQEMVRSYSRAELNAGSSIDVKMAMMAMTTKSSIRVKDNTLKIVFMA